MKHLAFAATLLALLLPALPAGAQQLIGSYVAYIGQADLYNSNGQRLTEHWQVLRQDRANYHRFGIRQRGDEWDPFFASMENRARMEQMVMHTPVDPLIRREILAGNVSVLVRIYGYGGQGQYVTVHVLP